jgi:hypothetical protein
MPRKTTKYQRIPTRQRNNRLSKSRSPAIPSAYAVTTSAERLGAYTAT